MRKKLDKKMYVHFVGVGGIGVSALARYYLSLGSEVSGSDVFLDKDLEKEGAKIFSKHAKENLPKNLHLLIYSSAVPEDNEEIVFAKRKGVKVQSYAEALGDLTRKFYTIAVSGTHGKSTTTAMLSLIMIRAGLDPTVILGTKLKEFGGKNFRKGRSKYLLIEADEFRAAFLNYSPKVVLITNVDEDHLDFYKNREDILQTFRYYLEKKPKKEAVFLNADDRGCKSLEKILSTPLKKYSLFSSEAKKINLKIPGRHNLSNALGAFFVSKYLQVKEKTVLQALSSFSGSWRRFEEKTVKTKNGSSLKIIIDYAHHPTEIKATLQAVREKYPRKKIFLVFQPHQHERTYRLFSRFVEILSAEKLEKLVITDIYTVKGRESEEVVKKVSAKKLASNVNKAVYIGNLKKTAEYILSYLPDDGILVIMGAGDVYKLEGMLKV